MLYVGCVYKFINWLQRFLKSWESLANWATKVWYKPKTSVAHGGIPLLTENFIGSEFVSAKFVYPLNNGKHNRLSRTNGIQYNVR